ncbi:MAG TPA: glycosyltransferase family 1 protein [bacterium]|nr:glycosyltransferase family 1 protein [bacterium]
MKVAYFTESLPPNMDGVSHTLLQISKYMDSNGVDLRFLSPFKPDESHWLCDRVRQVRSIPFPMYTAYRVSFPIFENLDDYLDEFQPDLIHVISPTPLCIYGLRYARDRQLPAVGSYHTHFVSYLKYYGFGQLESIGWRYIRWFYNQCRRVYVPSMSVREDLQAKGVRNIHVLPHGIDTARFSPEYRSNRIRRYLVGKEDIPVLLFVGRLVKEKDLAELVTVNKLLQEKGFRFKMVFIGDGPMKQELQKQLPDAHFTGTLTGNELSQWYASSDLFLFPSTTETFGLVVQEAFASGIPVIGVRKGGVENLIQEGVNGFLTEPNTPPEFTEKVQQLLEDPDLRRRLGHNARALVMQHSWDTVNQELLESYYALTTKDGHPEGAVKKARDTLVPTDSDF